MIAGHLYAAFITHSIRWPCKGGEIPFQCQRICLLGNTMTAHALTKSRYMDRMADSINLNFDMDATWKKSRIFKKSLKRDFVAVKSIVFVQIKSCVRLKFLLFIILDALIT